MESQRPSRFTQELAVCGRQAALTETRCRQVSQTGGPTAARGTAVHLGGSLSGPIQTTARGSARGTDFFQFEVLRNVRPSRALKLPTAAVPGR